MSCQNSVTTPVHPEFDTYVTLREAMERVMRLIGVSSVSELGPEHVRRIQR
jgi:hypothetical protein